MIYYVILFLLGLCSMAIGISRRSDDYITFWYVGGILCPRPQKKFLAVRIFQEIPGGVGTGYAYPSFSVPLSAGTVLASRGMLAFTRSKHSVQMPCDTSLSCSLPLRCLPHHAHTTFILDTSAVPSRYLSSPPKLAPRRGV
jgi:hypothetical protein